MLLMLHLFFWYNTRSKSTLEEVENVANEASMIIEDGVLKNGRQCEGEVVVPEGVTEIAEKAFYNNKKLTGLVIPEGVTRIGRFAVSGCRELKYVQVPDSVTSMGDQALMRKFESDVGFTHVMENKEHYPEIRCHAGSWIDQKMREIKASDTWADSHGTKHLVEIVNI